MWEGGFKKSSKSTLEKNLKILFYFWKILTCKMYVITPIFNGLSSNFRSVA